MKAAIIILMVLLFPLNASAIGRFAIGPEAGIAYQTEMAPNSSSLDGAMAFCFGVSGVYEFSKELKRFAIDYSVGMARTDLFTHRNVVIEGATGTFREKILAIHWLFGGRYYWGDAKWRPYAGLATGFEYFRRTDIDYRDLFNQALPIPPVSNHFNLVFAPQFGIEYRPTFRWAFGLGVRAPMAIRASGIVPAVQVPLVAQVAF